MNLDMSWWLPTPETSIPEAALRYVEHGFNPIPWPPPESLGLPNKHRVRRWFVSADPCPDVGWYLRMTYHEYVCLVVDGDAGQASLQRQQERIGQLPTTLTAANGQLTHMFFISTLPRHTEPIVLGPGLSISDTVVPVPPTGNWKWIETITPHPLPERWRTSLTTRLPRPTKAHAPLIRLPRHGQSQGRWRNAKSGDPCPVCRGVSWCSVSIDGATVCCRRVESDEPRIASNGIQYWVHQLSGVEHVRRNPPEPRASLDMLHLAYSALLSASELSEEHREHLQNRGLSGDQIRLREYKTLPSDHDRRTDIAAAVVAALPQNVNPTEIPGLVLHDGRWTVAGATGILVPCRDMQGRVVALKIRQFGSDSPKYLYLSSGDGGPRAISTVHVPLFSGDRSEVRITEGELKADVCTALSGVWTLSVPGVGSWAQVFVALDKIQPHRVRVAFDADYREKPAVHAATVALVQALKQEKYSVEVETWDRALGNGLDDLLTRVS